MRGVRSWRRATPTHPRARPRLVVDTADLPKRSLFERIAWVAYATVISAAVLATLAWFCAQAFALADWVTR